ncbi:MAG: flavodoxin family protein [Nanobdellota archaeon]
MITIISASPRKSSNSIQIADYISSRLESSGFTPKIISLAEVHVKGCIACNGCVNEKKCVNDKEANEVNNALRDSKAIIVVTPVYFGSITSQLKALFDKTLPLRRNGFELKGKLGGAVSIGRSRNGGQELAIKDIHSWMLIHGMLVLGDSSHFGGMAVSDFAKDKIGKDSVERLVDGVVKNLV